MAGNAISIVVLFLTETVLEIGYLGLGQVTIRVYYLIPNGISCYLNL